MNKNASPHCSHLRSVNEITHSRRMRRMRKNLWSRNLVQENELTIHDLVWPVFVTNAASKREPVASMPGVFLLGIKEILLEVERAARLGIAAVALFPVIPKELKDTKGSYILSPENPLNKAIAAIKREIPDIGIITDVALDPFTSHGHDGLLHEGIVLNDATVSLLARASVVQAQAGADIIAPSDMMDGRVGAIREALDKNRFEDIAIMSYAAKFASAFYGPYRNAVGTKELLQGDKKTYYLDPANAHEAMREIKQDIEEGADIVIIKPGLPYLDIIRRAKKEFRVPVFGYQVSGEYSMIKAASHFGWLQEDKAMLESLIAFKRAGCRAILSYFACEAAKLLKT